MERILCTFSLPNITYWLQIQQDKWRLGSCHTAHRWGPFRVHYPDGTVSRRQSWLSARKLAAQHGGEIYHIPSNTRLQKRECYEPQH